MKTTHTCIIGDARKMELVADESVHLVRHFAALLAIKDMGRGANRVQPCLRRVH